MRPRFYVPDLDPSAERVPLPSEEAEHLARVLRLGAGAVVDVIDGRGGLWHAEVVQADKRSADVRLIERGQAAAESRVPITLAMCVLKADKMDDVVRDAVMLGVVAIQPIVSERAEIRIATLVKSERVARWQRIAVASAKQCGRAVVPVIHDAVPIDRYWSDPTYAVRVMCVEPSAAAGQVASIQNVAKPPSAHVVVGPEGGFTGPEVDAARASGVILISLGARTLRADAVPIVALTALLTTWSELT